MSHIHEHKWANGKCLECFDICRHPSRDQYGRCVVCGGLKLGTQDTVKKGYLHD